jgi:hypothetical protein
MKTKYSMFLIEQKSKKKLKKYCFARVDNTSILPFSPLCVIYILLKVALNTINQPINLY